MFFCQQEPGEDCGGETPLVKSTDILSQLDPKILQTFAKKKVRYVRYAPPRGPGAYLPWQDVFITDDPKVCLFFGCNSATTVTTMGYLLVFRKLLLVSYRLLMWAIVYCFQQRHYSVKTISLNATKYTRGDSYMKGAWTFVVSLRGVNFGFWSHLGCSGQNAIIFSRQGLV